MIENYVQLRRERLDAYKQKQPFRVTIGKSAWQTYEKFDERYNMREILDDEIVCEFDCDDLEIVVRAISQTGLNLLNAGYVFEYWEHGGKSPHLHIHNLPIKHLSPSDRAMFKKIFLKKYVPVEYLQYVDMSLTGIHMIALEWSEHWKGCYGVKRLIQVFKLEKDKDRCERCHDDNANCIIRNKSYCKKCVYEVLR